MGPDLLFADLVAGLCNQEPERPLDPFWIRHADYGRFSHARVPEDQVLKPETEVEKLLRLTLSHRLEVIADDLESCRNQALALTIERY